MQLREATQSNVTDLVSAHDLNLAAIKTIYVPAKDDNDDDRFLSEISCLQCLRQHPNIIQLLDSFSSGTDGGGQRWSLVLPYCPVDLYTVLEWKRQALQPLLSQNALLRISSHLFSALAHCHSIGIVHGDIKPGNLLVNAESGMLQLCDFGIAHKRVDGTEAKTKLSEEPHPAFAPSERPIDSTDQVSTQAHRKPRALCTLQYRPPEILLGLSPTEHADCSMDIFSAGVTLAECVAGRMIFPGTNDLGQLSLYFQTLGTPSLQTWPGVINLPDWGKLSFASHPSNPVWYHRTLPRLAEFPMDDVLTRVIVDAVQLNPSRRCSANQCHQQFLQQPRQKDVDEDTNSDTLDFISEMVPSRLHQIPLLLKSANDCFDVLDLQIKKTARTRREFISSLDPWNRYACCSREG